MTDNRKTVDGFRFLSPSLRAWIGNGNCEPVFKTDQGELKTGDLI